MEIKTNDYTIKPYECYSYFHLKLILISYILLHLSEYFIFIVFFLLLKFGCFVPDKCIYLSIEFYSTNEI